MNRIELKLNKIMAEAQSKFKKLLEDRIQTEHSEKEEELTQQSQVGVEPSEANSENIFELVKSNGAAWNEINSNSILNTIPNETFDNLLKYLPIEDIRKLLIACKSINQRVRKSFYQTLKRKVEDWSIYKDAILCKNAQEYLSLDYVSTDFQIGERPKVEENIIVGDRFEVNAGAKVYDEVGSVNDIVLIGGCKIQTFPLISDDIFLHLQCTWLSVKTFDIQHITRLDLCDSGLTGIIPLSIGTMVNLGSLYLEENNLIGMIPHSIGNLVQLEYLDLSGNQLTGKIPKSIQNLVFLERLSLHNNQLSGFVPQVLATLPELVKLNLSGNQLEGKLLRPMSREVELWRLDDHNN